MATTISAPDLTARLADLRAKRPGLALQAARGDAGARQQLAAVDADIAAAERDLEVLALAEQEAGRIAAVEREAAAAEERRRLEAEYAAAMEARTVAYRKIEDTLDELTAHARMADAAALELDRLAGALGRAPAAPLRWQTQQAIARRLGILAWQRLGWPGPLPVGPDEPLATREETPA